MKKCKKCEMLKDLNDFNKWYKKTGSQGIRTKCKECERAENKLYRINNKKKLQEKRRIRTGSSEKLKCIDELKIKRNKRMYKSQKKYPQKVFARRVLNFHIRTNKIIKPENCEICNTKIKLEAHHENYLDPLMVKWVCKKCHTLIHWNK